MTTKIEWAEDVWNPLRAILPKPEWGSTGWHCERVSAGCQHCYAETLNVAQRFGNGTGLPYNRKSRDMVNIELHEDTLAKPLHWRKPRRVFVCSMTDLFGEWVPDEYLDRMFAVMALAPQHQFLVLTKRPERMREYLSGEYKQIDIVGQIEALPVQDDGGAIAWEITRGDPPRWPLPNCWLGVSVEDQAAADQRIPVLLETPAAVRFLSCEPLLGPVALGTADNWLDAFGGIDWVIVGGESGPGARPCNVAWIRSIVEQCQAAQVPVFIKQLGSGYVHDSEYPRGNGLPDFSMTRYSRRKNRKGGDPADWPEDIRIREMPR